MVPVQGIGIGKTTDTGTQSSALNINYRYSKLTLRKGSTQRRPQDFYGDYLYCTVMG